MIDNDSNAVPDNLPEQSFRVLSNNIKLIFPQQDGSPANLQFAEPTMNFSRILSALATKDNSLVHRHMLRFPSAFVTLDRTPESVQIQEQPDVCVGFRATSKPVATMWAGGFSGFVQIFPVVSCDLCNML
jgi:hypothetical protein